MCRNTCQEKEKYVLPQKINSEEKNMTGINTFGANNMNVARIINVNAANAYKAVQKEAESLKMNLNKVDCFVKTTETQQVAKEEVQDMKKAKGKGKGKGNGKLKKFVKQIVEWLKDNSETIVTYSKS